MPRREVFPMQTSEMGDITDLFLIESAVADALRYKQSADQYRMMRACMDASSRIAGSAEDASAENNESMARYMGVAGCLWGAGAELYDAMRENLDPIWGNLTPGGKRFVEDTLKEAAAGRAQRGTLLHDILARAEPRLLGRDYSCARYSKRPFSETLH